jgi:2-dehydro-3-deoxyphosphogluconate aldolase / (4S)-4-hydroxy-2-oxoglutarate aldolase
MVYRHDVMVRIAAVRVVAIVRADSAGTAEQVGRAVLDGGLDAATARLAILAGARFIVSPGLHPGVVETAHRYGAAVLPGAQTPTEVERALSAGADAVKVFPAAQLGPGWLSAVRAALPHAPLVPTGGITPDTAGQWLDAGALAVGVGGALTAGGDTDVTARTRALLDDLGRAG